MSSSELISISCPVCWEVFDSEKTVPFVLSCGHCICVLCNENKNNLMKNCPTCRIPIITQAKNFSYIETLEKIGNVHKRIEELENPNINHQCSECQKWTLPENMHLCKTCIVDEGLLELTEIVEEERAKRVVEVSMCSDCIVPLHAYKGHIILAMLPIYNEHIFEPDLSIFESKWVEFKDSLDSLSEQQSLLSCLHFKIKIGHGCMSRRSGNENLEKKILEKRDEFMDKAISFCEAAELEFELNPINIENRFSYSSKSLNFESKLDEFEHAYTLLEMTFSKQRYALSEEGDDSYAKFVAMARQSKSIAQQNEVFEKMDEFINEAKKIHEGIKTNLEDCMEEVDKSLKQAYDWCKTETVAFTEENKNIG